MILVRDQETLRGATEYLCNQSVIFFDIETTGLDPYTSRLLIVSLRGGGQTYVLDMVDLGLASLGLVRTLLENPDILKVAHNAIFDVKHLFHYGQIQTAPVHCTLITEQLLQAGLLNSGFGLDDVAKRYLGIEMDKTIREGFINRAEGVPFTDEELQYAARDVDVLEPIYKIQIDGIKRDNLERVYNLECNLIPVTANMEYNGVDINIDKLSEAEPIVRQLIARADKELQDEIIRAGIADQVVFDKDGYIAVNTGSPKQLLAAFNELGINVKTLGKKELSDWDAHYAAKNAAKKVEAEDYGVTDAGSDSDLHIGYSHPLLRRHAVRTAAAKIHGTYILGLMDRINPVTRRLYPGYKQCGAVATGRFSSVSPNFQNIPNAGKLRDLGLGEYDIRSMFIPRPGYDFIISDYSGIELAILAAMSGDENLTHQILDGDIHSYVANSLAGDKIIKAFGSLITKETKKIPEVKQLRDLFKPVSYGTIYGSTGYNLYRTLYFALATLGVHITQDDADEWVRRWKFELFPETGKLLSVNSEFAVLRYYTESALGRRRRWSPEVRQDKWRMLAAMREGSNHPIQATSADMIKIAMVDLHNIIDTERGRIVACIHDELLVESRKDYTDECAVLVKNVMESAGHRLFPNTDPRLITAEPKISDRYNK